jgi:hypothetical protein
MSDELTPSPSPEPQSENSEGPKSSGEAPSIENPGSGAIDRLEPDTKAPDGGESNDTPADGKKSPTKKASENQLSQTHIPNTVKIRNLFNTKEDTKTDLGGKPQDQERPFKDSPKEQLKNRQAWIRKYIGTLDERESRLSDECADIYEQIERADFNQERGLKRVLKDCELKKDACKAERDNLRKELQQIGRELEQREADGNHSEPAPSVDMLFRIGEMADDAITNTVLYTATFFEDLSPSDFRSVVSVFLKGRTGSVETRLSPKAADQKNQEEPSKEKPSPRTQITQIDLDKRWQDSFYQDNRYLKNCTLKACRENGAPVIAFVNPNTREDLIRFFQNEQPLFIDAQFQRVEELMFDGSEAVAERAIQLLAYDAIAQNETWLIKVAEKAPDSRSDTFYNRFTDLIYKIQLTLDPLQSESILIQFFRALLLFNKAGVFAVMVRLIYRHLRSESSFDILNAVDQLMNWLKEIVDNPNLNLKEDVSDVLELILIQDDSYTYLYDFLEIFQTWLPNQELSYENYKNSHIIALELLIGYCTVTMFNFDTSHYGKFPSEYVLFKPFSKLSPAVCENRLYLLVRWLFYFNSNDQQLAIEPLLDDADITPSQLLGFIVSEWFAILYGLQKGAEPQQPAAKEFTKIFLNQIILVTNRAEQRLLSEFWTELMDGFLDAAEECDQRGEYAQRKQLTARRSLVKELKRMFRELQSQNS